MVEDKIGGMYPITAGDKTTNLGCGKSLYRGNYAGRTVSSSESKNWIIQPGFWGLENLTCDSRCWLCWECAVKLGKVW